VKNDAQAFIGKVDRITGLAIPAAGKNKLDDPLAAGGTDGFKNTVLRPRFIPPGLHDRFLGV